VHLDAVEHGDALVFMHAVQGPARPIAASACRWPRWPACRSPRCSRHAARLAELESQNRDAPMRADERAQALDAPQQFGLFASRSAALDALAGIDPDELSPKAGARSAVPAEGAALTIPLRIPPMRAQGTRARAYNPATPRSPPMPADAAPCGDRASQKTIF
jgi:DNA mismatch repair protein MutS